MGFVGRKGKDRTAAQKRADAAASRRMKGTNPFGNKKRRGGGKRRRSAPKAPRRRRSTMAKGTARRRARGTKVTPKRIVKAVVVIDGVRRVVTGDYTTILWYLKNKPAALLGDAWKDPAFTSKLVQPATGVAEILVAPKGIDAAVSFVSKGEPMLGKLANFKIIKIGA